MISPPQGFGIPLVDFASFVVFAMLADRGLLPSPPYRWLWFVLCVMLALFFFAAWIVDLGARLRIL